MRVAFWFMKQSQAMTILMSGRSVFLTGAPGAGKSYLLSKFVQNAISKGRKVAVTASTGIAATHISGSTIHSWSQIGIKESLDSKDLAAFGRRGKLISRFLNTDVLVIDEVSMLSGNFLSMLDTLAKELRRDHRPFGGLQMVLVGDMFQLPPVSRSSSDFDFAHESSAWKDLDPLVCYLDEQHRQGDDGLLAVLEAMRRGTLNDDHIALLEARRRIRPPAEEEVTRLFAHNVDVDSINHRRLALLGGTSASFDMRPRGPSAAVEQLAKRILAPGHLELKVGAEVMFVANDPSKAFANGSRGRVARFEQGRVVVELADGHREINVSPYLWQHTEDDEVVAEISQLPLRLAWAITIHKSQGMSIDSAEVDLSRTFAPGMGYVALSRLRSLDGLYIKGMNSMALVLNDQIFELDERLRAASDALAESTSEYGDEGALSDSD